MLDKSIHKDGIYDIDTSKNENTIIKNEDNIFIILVVLLMAM